VSTSKKGADVVVIGLGAGGGTAVLPLAQAGLDVVALEAGGRFSVRDFHADEIRNDIRNWLGRAKVNDEVPTQRRTAAEEAGRDADERRRQQADLVFAREHEPPEATDDQTRDRKPEKLEREADERPGQQQSQDDDEQDGDDGHGEDATERRRRTRGGQLPAAHLST